MPVSLKNRKKISSKGDERWQMTGQLLPLFLKQHDMGRNFPAKRFV
jgi:hypothetical protein